MLYLCGIILVATAFWGNKRLSYGCALMVALRFILPPIIRIGPISFNTAIIAVLSVLCMYKLGRNSSLHYRVMQKKWMFPFTYLVVPLALFCLCAPLDVAFQYKALIQFVLTEIMPFYIVACAIQEKEAYDLILKTFLMSFAIVGIWGIITYIIRSNPLYTFFITMPGNENVANFTGEGFDRIRGGLSSSASGNLSGPLPWGQFSLLVFLMIFLYTNIRNKFWGLFLLFLACANTFLSTKRSVILPMIIALAYIFYKNGLKSKKKMLSALFCLVVGLGILSQTKIVDSYVQNIKSAVLFWNDDYASKASISGSSKEGRMLQLTTAFGMIENNLLFGLGYNYPAYYESRKGMHPIMIGYESLLFSVVSSGIMGLFCWFLFFWKGFQFTKGGVISKEKNILFHFCYMASLLLTGIQASLFLYMIIIAMIRRKNELYWEESV